MGAQHHVNWLVRTSDKSRCSRRFLDPWRPSCSDRRNQVILPLLQPLLSLGLALVVPPPRIQHLTWHFLWLGTSFGLALEVERKRLYTKAKPGLEAEQKKQKTT